MSIQVDLSLLLVLMPLHGVFAIAEIAIPAIGERVSLDDNDSNKL